MGGPRVPQGSSSQGASGFCSEPACHELTLVTERALPLAALLWRRGRLLAAWDRRETALSCPSPSQEWGPGPAESGPHPKAPQS